MATEAIGKQNASLAPGAIMPILKLMADWRRDVDEPESG
jgi:hypothetical protein